MFLTRRIISLSFIQSNFGELKSKTFFCLSQARTWISIVIMSLCHGLFQVEWVEVRVHSFLYSWCNCRSSLYKLSFHNGRNICSLPLSLSLTWSMTSRKSDVDVSIVFNNSGLENHWSMTSGGSCSCTSSSAAPMKKTLPPLIQYLKSWN